MKSRMAVNRVLFTMIFTASVSCVAGQDKTKFSGCRLAKSTIADGVFIKENAKLILKTSNDKCIIQLLDSLAKKAIEKKEVIYWKCLESFAAISDGYVSEYFTETGFELFHNGFNQFFSFLYNNHRQKRANPLEKVMIEAVSMQLSTSSDRKTMQKNIDDHIKTEIKKGGFTNDQLIYLSSIRKRFDPNIFD